MKNNFWILTAAVLGLSVSGFSGQQMSELEIPATTQTDETAASGEVKDGTTGNGEEANGEQTTTEVAAVVKK